MESAFLEPVVVLYAIFEQIGFKNFFVNRERVLDKRFLAFVLGLFGERFSAEFIVIFFRMLNDINSEINVLGHIERVVLVGFLFLGIGNCSRENFTAKRFVIGDFVHQSLSRVRAKLKIAQIQRFTELGNLISRVVHIELAVSLIACFFKQGSQAVADSAAARVSDVHRTCRICRNKFHKNALSVAEIGFSVIRAERNRFADNFIVPTVAEEKVEEPGTRKLDFPEKRAFEVDCVLNHLAERAGICFKRFRGNKRRVRGKIAVRVVGRHGHGKRRERLRGDFSLGNKRPQRLHNYFGNLGFCFFNCIVIHFLSSLYIFTFIVISFSAISPPFTSMVYFR